MGCLFISLLGAAIYGIVSILPLFYQTLMGYTAMAAGIAVSPRGIGAVPNHAARRGTHQSHGQPLADRGRIRSVCLCEPGDVRADFGYFKMVVAHGP